MRVLTFCATQRGYRFVRKLTELLPQAELVVFSFPEDPWEPRYLSDIRELTLAKGGQFYVAKQVGSKKWNNFWDTVPIDLMFVVSWRFLIPPSVYQRSRLGTYVFHDSMLPEYRGFSPTVWAIVNGLDYTGVTMFKIAEGVDEGNIIAQQRVPITSDDTISVVIDRVTQAYQDVLEQNLRSLIDGTAKLHPQDHSLATYTCKRVPEDNQIDWSNSTSCIYNLIWAVTYPYPGAFTYLNGKKIYIWSAKRVLTPKYYVGKIPGRVVEILPGEGSIVLTQDGCLLITQAQLEGGEIFTGDKILNNLSLTLGR